MFIPLHHLFALFQKTSLSLFHSLFSLSISSWLAFFPSKKKKGNLGVFFLWCGERKGGKESVRDDDGDL
jgi:hypothetical protein